MTVDFETKCEQTALDYIKIHLQEGYLVTAYKDVGNYYWESVYKIRASLSTDRKTEPNCSEKPNNCDEPQTDKHKCRRCVYYDVSSDYYPCVSCIDYSNYTGEITDCPWK